MPDESKVPVCEKSSVKNDEEIRGKEKVGAVIYAVISFVNIKICYDLIPVAEAFVNTLKQNGVNSLFLLLISTVGIILVPTICTSAAAYFSRLIIGAPISGAGYYAAVTAFPYLFIAYLLLGANNLLLLFPLLISAAMSLLCTHAIITYEKGKPFHI